MRKKYFKIALLSTLFLASSINANKEYNSLEEFEKAEGQMCKVATDGCNTIIMNDGKVGATTLKMCYDIPRYSCIEKKETKTNEEKKSEFTKKYGKTCEVATDGVNTHMNLNGEFTVSTRVGYSPDFVADWTCLKEKSSEKLTENDKNLLKYLKTKIGAVNVRIIENFFENFDKNILNLKEEEKNKKIIKTKEIVSNYVYNLYIKNPADKAMSPSDSFKYSFAKYLDLRLNEKY